MPPYSSFAQGLADDDDGNSSGRRPALIITGFTANLMETIAVSKSKVQEWVDHEKAKADAASESYRQHLRQQQNNIDSQAAELLAIQLERGMKIESPIPGSGESAYHEERRSSNNGDGIATRKQDLENQIAKIQIEVLKLETERDNRDRRVKDIAIEESKHRLRAQDARVLKEQAEEAKRTTVDDLTRGVVNYKYLGLDFQQTDKENEMRFSFSQLDADDPLKQFSFVLLLDEEQRYDIVGCNPEIDATKLMEILMDLNQTDDMSLLVRKMRRAFQNTISTLW